MSTPNRNDPCPCGSGKKYKKCCMGKPAAHPGLAVQAARPAGSGRYVASVAAPAELLLQGVALHQAGRLDEAGAIYQDLLRRNPADCHALHYLGLIALQRGNHAEAVRLIESAIRSDRRIPAFHCNLGNAYKGLHQYDRAVAAMLEAVRLDPAFQAAYCNMGNTYLEQGQFDAALDSYRKALGLGAGLAEAHYGLGNTLQKLNRLEEAVSSYRQAIALKPDYAEAYNNLGQALQGQGKLEEAVSSYHSSLEIRPNYANAYSNLIYLHAFTRDISPEEELKLASDWEKAILGDNEQIAARSKAFSFENPSRKGRKLKIGIVSAELGQHPVADFLEPLLEAIDRSRFHITLYPSVKRSEARAGHFQKLADKYQPLDEISDMDSVNLIRADQIDVLIDTTGHMNGCRLGIFARRAAPVQCHYIGYHGSTGLTEMDWFIADEVLVPPALDSHFREKIWRLPRLRLAYRGDAEIAESKWSPAPDGTIWLGSFNNLTKVREQALGLWTKVMLALPESKLFLKSSKSKDPYVQQRIRTELDRYGISGERVEFSAWTPDWSSHMALYDRLDIALDAIPLNSETTAFDALWMGAPLVALEGNWYGARMASTLLKAFKRPEWVAQTEDEYVDIVYNLARNVEMRKELRKKQRSLMAGSQLCDASGLAKTLEDAFEAMFDQWLEKKAYGAHVP